MTATTKRPDLDAWARVLGACDDAEARRQVARIVHRMDTASEVLLSVLRTVRPVAAPEVTERLQQAYRGSAAATEGLYDVMAAFGRHERGGR